MNVLYRTVENSDISALVVVRLPGSSRPAAAFSIGLSNNGFQFVL